MAKSDKAEKHRPYDELSLLEKVAASLSEHGNASSVSAPYKQITGVSLAETTYNRAGNAISGKIEIHSDHQSPYGDFASYVTSFELTEAEVAEMAKTGPDSFRARFNQLAKQLATKKKAALEAAKQAMRDMLASPEKATALKAPVTALRRARFSKKPTD